MPIQYATRSDWWRSGGVNEPGFGIAVLEEGIVDRFLPMAIDHRRFFQPKAIRDGVVDHIAAAVTETDDRRRSGTLPLPGGAIGPARPHAIVKLPRQLQRPGATGRM